MLEGVALGAIDGSSDGSLDGAMDGKGDGAMDGIAEGDSEGRSRQVGLSSTFSHTPISSLQKHPKLSGS